MTYPLLACYAFFCAVIGAALGHNAESAWLMAAFVVVGVIFFQVGFVAAIFLKG
jgi:hypothetical protein